MNFAQLSLDSVNRHSNGDWVEDPKLSLMAVMEDNVMYIDGWERRIEDRFHVRLEFENWTESINEIYDFLEHHIKSDRSVERRTTIGIQDGYFHMEKGGREYESENPDEISISAHQSRITFNSFGLNGPWIYLFEEAEDDSPLDDKNARRLLNFLKEIAQESGENGPGESVGIPGLHPDLAVAGVVGHLQDGDYQSAINDSFKVLEEEIRARGEFKNDTYGTDLMHQALHVTEGPITIGEIESEEEGFLKLYSGAFQAYRNPSVHRSLDLDWQQAHHIVSLVNLLMIQLPD